MVIDEWAGLQVSFLALSTFDFLQILSAFVLFRIFDITKPPLVSHAEKLPGAYGVMADDLVAGLYAGIVLFSLQQLGAL